MQSLRNVNEPEKAFEVNVEVYTIAGNQYFLLLPQYFNLWMTKPVIRAIDLNYAVW